MRILRRPIPGWASLAATAVLGAVVGVVLFGAFVVARTDLGLGQVELRARWSPSGRTELQVPPFGTISAETHVAPIGFELQIGRVDLEAMQRLLITEDPTQELPRLRSEAEDQLTKLIRSFTFRALVIAAVGGAIAGAIIPRRSRTSVVLGGLAGVAVAGALLAVAWASYRPEAFANARFEGPIERAPKLFATVRQYVDGFGTVSDRLEILSDHLTNLYATSSGALESKSGPGTHRVLHVSDIHLNPVGLEVTRQLAEQFNVDAIVDTGDLTTFGLLVEARLGEAIASMPAPYYLVPGNHDSRAVREALAATPNLTILDKRAVTIRGPAKLGPTKIAGVGHPSFTASNEVSDDDVDADLRAQARVVRTLVRKERPDVLAVHDVRQARPVVGSVPLVLAGHTHETASRQDGRTLQLTVGSTGATGLGAFTVDTDLAYHAQVLSFDDNGLVAVDRVMLRGTSGEFRIDRELVK